MCITNVYHRLPQDDKYGLSQALLSNLSEIAPELFNQTDIFVYKKRRLRHLDQVDHSILSFRQKRLKHSGTSLMPQL